ncbi:MFS transporter [Demequina iriomotensis]|uniref:MFS transporter n=1 Tax=Demequina iriomotensis TaxID=1536641 RepID=UPI000781E9E9|nr:MFS transporter [Demequina iriomotensis]
MTSETTTSTGPAASERSIPRGRVFAWALWDWATQPYNSVIITFVFAAVYLVSDSFMDPAVVALGEDDPAYEAAKADLSGSFGLAMTLAAVVIALLAPVIGQRADTSGRRKRSLAWCTGLLVLCMAALYFVEAAPAYFVLGAGLIAVGSIFSEIGGVHYNALITQVTTPRTMGRVSGLGWGFGYTGGIVALVVVVLLSEADWFGMDTSNGMAYRLIAVGCALWTVAFAWPLFRYVPEAPGTGRAAVSLLGGYARLWRDLVRLWREERHTLWFLLSSAIYRDGLAGVFTFGAIIASAAYGFSTAQVMYFGVAANLVAGVATMASGLLDDRFGARRLILWSLGGMVVAGLAVAFLEPYGTVVFWVAGLVLCLFVGPVQSASRSLLARISPAGKQGEIFGLYATTGRAVSFLAPAMWWLAIQITHDTIWGVLGIISVILAGFVSMLFVKLPVR